MNEGLQADALTVRFGDVVAVQRVSVHVRPGELVAVTGPSGAGKSSLLTTLAGIRRPAEGTVRVDGAELADRDDAVRRRVVIVAQGNALVRLLSAQENVALSLLARRHRHVRETIEEVLRAVGLDEAAGQLVDELSGGQQQRLALARALAERGDVLLADEPTSELDAGNRAVVMQLLRAEATRGAAVLVATHDPDAAALCDAELRLDDGVGRWIREQSPHLSPHQHRNAADE